MYIYVCMYTYNQLNRFATLLTDVEYRTYTPPNVNIVEPTTYTPRNLDIPQHISH